MQTAPPSNPSPGNAVPSGPPPRGRADGRGAGLWLGHLSDALMGLLDASVALVAVAGARMLALLAQGEATRRPPRGIVVLSVHVTRLMRAGQTLALLGAWLDAGNRPVFRSQMPPEPPGPDPDAFDPAVAAPPALTAALPPGGGLPAAPAGPMRAPPGPDAIMRGFARRPIEDILDRLRAVLTAAAHHVEHPALLARVRTLLHRAEAALLRLRLALCEGCLDAVPDFPDDGEEAWIARTEAASLLA
ncbi:MAG: hypothetical protein JSR21_20635 [Proteobacteria bacterium]|nr:hypothetical protein [Pseudomonadota bacterium]